MPGCRTGAWSWPRKTHCRKDTEERGLFSEDRAALLPLPGKRFDVGRVAAYEGRPVRRGRARGRHRCSAVCLFNRKWAG